MSVDEDAARIALIALGATIPRWESLDDRRVRVGPVDTILPTETATKFLASMPKPLICYASVENGLLAVECELVAEATAIDRRIYEVRQESSSDDLWPGLTERFGEGDHLVAVLGRGNPIVVPISAVRAWSHDYEIAYSISNISDELDPDAAGDAQLEAVRRLGARGVMQFSSHSDHVETVDGRYFPYPPADTASRDEIVALEKGLIGIAKSLLFVMDDEEELATVERGLVERGELPADASSPHGRDHDAYVHGVFASQMTHFFQGRAMPPEVAAFVDACRGS